MAVQGKIIAIDLGGTHLRTALVENNKILKFIKKDTPKETNLILSEMCDSISQLMDSSVIGIGVASPGPLKDGIIKNPPNLPFRNFNLKAYLQSKFRKKVEVENDATCVALAELKLGCRRKNFVIVTLGTGVGGGIIINGEIYHGAGYGGEINGVVVNEGRSLEDLWKDHRRLSLLYFGKVLLIADLLKRKNERARVILNDTSKYLGQGIASLINALDPEIVVLAGGPSETGSKFLEMIRKNAYKHVVLPKKTPIEWTKLENPGILGASLLILDSTTH
jgi:glucokinase